MSRAKQLRARTPMLPQGQNYREDSKKFLNQVPHLEVHGQKALV
jgi:hypothetical protein